MDDGRLVLQNDADNSQLRRAEKAPEQTVLYDQHVGLTDKSHIVPFAGYLMPLWYSSIAAEHNAVREAAGIFDCTHMGILVKDKLLWFMPTENRWKKTTRSGYTIRQEAAARSGKAGNRALKRESFWNRTLQARSWGDLLNSNRR